MDNNRPTFEQLTLIGMPASPVPLSHSPHSRVRLQLNERVTVLREPPYQHFYVDGRPYLRVRTDRSEEQRLAVVLLVESGAITKTAVAEAMGVSFRSIGYWQQAYEQRGVEGLKRGNIIETERQPDDSRQRADRCALEPQTTGADDVKKNKTVTPDERSLREQTVRSSRYLGLLLLAPFLRSLLEPIWQYIKEHGEAFEDGLYSWGTAQLTTLITLYTAWGIDNAEQSKMLRRDEFGVLLDREESPSCRTFRRRLPLLAKGDLPFAAPRILARTLLELGWIRLGELYLDGHFVPYHGKGSIAKGWWPQRQSPKKGYYQHWVNDRQGKPLFCMFHPGFVAFPHIIPEMVREIQALLNEAGVAEEQPLILIFDRGAYSASLFKELDAMGVGWITYKKYAPDVDRSELTEIVGMASDREEPTFVHYKIMRLGITDYRDDVYAIAFDGRKGKSPATLITNVDRVVPERCIPAFLIHALRDRWAQENFFKVAKVREGIDHLMGHDIRPIEESDHWVPNPEVVKLRQRAETLRQHLKKAEHQYAALVERYKQLQKKPSWGRYLDQKRNQKVIQRLGAIQQELEQCENRINALPDQVRYDTLNPKVKHAVDFDRNRVVLALKSVAYHAREALLRVAERYFFDHRERTKLVQVLLESGGRYVRGKKTDTVYLQPPLTPVYRAAMADLLAYLNAMEPQTLGDTPRPLRFRIG